MLLPQGVFHRIRISMGTKRDRDSGLVRLQDLVLQLVLRALHLLFELSEAVSWGVWKATRRMGHLWRGVKEEGDLAGLRAELGGMEKRPRHLALVLRDLDEHARTWRKLALVVSWAMCGGVEVVSLYDEEGRIKADQARLLRELGRWGLGEEEDGGVEVVWRGQARGEEEVGVRSRLNGGNGRSSRRRKVTVCLLSSEDGKGDLVQAARSLARRVERGDLRPSEINENTVASSLSSTLKGLPDPDLLLVLGGPPHQGSGGYPPWQVRLTEMHGLTCGLGGVTKEDFVEVMAKFSRCQRRYGK